MVNVNKKCDNSREVVLQYLRCFCAGDIAGIEKLLSPDLSFNGPFHQYDSSESYIRSLRRNPPEKSSYKILSILSGDNTVAVFYEYDKPENKLLIAQHFKIRQDSICEILIVFDSEKIRSANI